MTFMIMVEWQVSMLLRVLLFFALGWLLLPQGIFYSVTDKAYMNLL